MARKGYGRHKKVVTGIPNDPDKEVSVDAWNDDVDSKGMLGLESTSATIVISSGNLTPTDTWTVVESETSPSADDLANILTTETSTEDILFIVGKSGDTITLKHQATGAGQIHTSTDADKTLDTNVPTLLIRRGTDWYEFGGSNPIAGTNIDVTGSTVSFDPTGGVDMSGNNLVNIGYFESNAGNPASVGAIRLGNTEKLSWRNNANTNDVSIDVQQANDTMIFTFNGSQKFQISSTLLTLAGGVDIFTNGSSIDNISSLTSNATNPADGGAIRLGNTESISWRNAGNTANVTLSVNGSNNFFFAGSGTVDINGLGIIMGNSDINLGGGDILNAGFIESNATNPAINGTIRLGSGEQIKSRNSLNSADSVFGYNALDVFEIGNGGAIDYTFAFNEADWKSNDLRNVGFFESNATNPADSGAIRLGNTESLAWRDSGNSANVSLTVDGNDQLNTTNGLVVGQMIQGAIGTDIASADAPTIPTDGSYFDITGTTQINHLTTTNIQAGTVIILQFDGSVTLTHQAGTPTGDEKDLWLAGATNASMTANDTITLVYDGTNWRETARSVN